MWLSSITDARSILQGSAYWARPSFTTVSYTHLTDVLPLAGRSREELLALAVALEPPSEHPLAQAIIAYGKEQNVPVREVKDFKAVFGKGVTAAVGGKNASAGNAALMEQHGPCLLYTSMPPAVLPVRRAW